MEKSYKYGVLHLRADTVLNLVKCAHLKKWILSKEIKEIGIDNIHINFKLHDLFKNNITSFCPSNTQIHINTFEIKKWKMRKVLPQKKICMFSQRKTTKFKVVCLNQ